MGVYSLGISKVETPREAGPRMMNTASLPRKVQISDYQPAKLIVRIDGYQPCAGCGEEIAYYHDRYLTGDWVHTGTERSRCATDQFNIANPAPRCSQCGSLDVVWTQQAWGDAKDCLDCGNHAFYSIGD